MAWGPWRPRSVVRKRSQHPGAQGPAFDHVPEEERGRRKLPGTLTCELEAWCEARVTGASPRPRAPRGRRGGPLPVKSSWHSQV